MPHGGDLHGDRAAMAVSSDHIWLQFDEIYEKAGSSVVFDEPALLFISLEYQIQLITNITQASGLASLMVTEISRPFGAVYDTVSPS